MIYNSIVIISIIEIHHLNKRTEYGQEIRIFKNHLLYNIRNVLSLSVWIRIKHFW